MLGRASKRAFLRDAVKQPLPGLEVIQLPFLYPAIFTPQPRSRRTTTGRPRSRRSPPETASSHFASRTTATKPLQHRNLASAAAAIAYDFEPHQDDFIPFEGPSNNNDLQKQQGPESHSFFSLPGFAPDMSPLILKNAPTTTSGKFRVVDSISGNLNEIHQTLHACLQVGRLDRAAALVRRLNQIYKAEAPGLIVAHNDYIREITLRIVRTKDQDLLKTLQRWFEVDLLKGGVVPTPATYALMIQASTHGSLDKHVDRSIKRYANLAQDAGLGEETMDLVSRLETSAQALKHFEEPTAHVEVPASVVLDTYSKNVQDIRAVEQKGLGLSTLKQSLQMLNEPIMDQDNRSDFLKNIEGIQRLPTAEERQKALERNTVQAALDRWHEEDAHLKSMGIVNVLSTSSLGAIMWKWHEQLTVSIREELRHAIEAEATRKRGRSKADEERLLWGPYLQNIPPEKLSALTILNCTKSVSLDSKDDRGMKVLHVVGALGSAIQEEALFENVKTNSSYRQWRALSQRSGSNVSSKGDTKTVTLIPASSSVDKSGPAQEYERLEWPTALRYRVGAMLLSLLIDVAKVEVCRSNPKNGQELREEQPVFFHTYSFQAGKRIGVIRLNPTMREKMSKAPMSPSLAKHLPMLTVPKPWVGFREGGFLEQAVSVIRFDKDDLQARRYAITASENGDMSKVFAGLDVLAKTPWKINRGVFDVMVEAWNSGEAIAKIPPENPAVDFPPEPPSTASTVDRLKWLRQVKEAENHKGGLRSQRCFQNLQMEVARAFLNETFYLPHNVDFRGRAYPMAPFLNHMGADNARGLLTFAKRLKLGSAGLWWLKVHLANVYGYDKASFQERLQFAEDHLPDIIDSAERGLHGGRWWLSAEDPWQCLAACMELANALKRRDPTTYMSSLAIHQDGTCNGLQHYAALGGDAAGAKQVNLEPGDRPSDIYTAVAEMIKAEVKADAEKGHALALHLDGKITRKVVKQTVMTNVYGVTFIGAKQQVRKQLDAALPTFPDTPAVNRNTAAGYIAQKIFASLAKMFNGAHDIQYWFGDCAGRICSSLSPYQVEAIKREQQGTIEPSMLHEGIRQLKGGPQADPHSFTTGVIWTTPLKMPVVQSYSKQSRGKVDTNFQLISIKTPTVMDPIHKSKQLQAFPPNFIHSLDGTHMFLTAQKCDQVGLTFAAVHDSFWTHAGDIDTLNRITREAFIRMHSENIVERLRSEFETRYAGYMHLASVHQQSEVSKRIRAWRKEHGHTDIGRKKSGDRTKELLLEVKRLELLASTKPEERREGAEMITPGSIYKQSGAGERLLAIPSDMPVGLGQVSSREMKLQANERLQVGDMDNAEPAFSDASLTPATTDAIAEEAGTIRIGDIIDATTRSYIPSTAPPKDDMDATWIRKAEERKRELRNSSAKKTAKLYLWVPLEFPPVPKKVIVML